MTPSKDMYKLRGVGLRALGCVGTLLLQSSTIVSLLRRDGDRQSAPAIDCARVRDSCEAPYAGGQTGSPGGAGREFSVAGIDDEYFVTADEGDLDGGSRSFTIS